MSRPLKLAALLLLVVVLFGLSLGCGKVWVPPGAWFSSDPRWWIILQLRLPRAVLGLALGATLGLSGAVLQGYLRNPLADPAVVGVSSVAALGAVAAIIFGIGSGFAIFVAAMLGAGGAVAGVIGFVGLVVPHLLRPIFGHRPSDVLLPSALGGAALVLAADSLVRLAPGAGEVRLGVAMALIGAPFFLGVLIRERGRAWI